MKPNRFIQKITLALSRAAVCFSLGTLFFSVGFAISGESIDPVKIIKIWITFFVIGIILFLRMCLDESKWAMGKPFILKNLLFMPPCLLATLILCKDLIRDEDFPNARSLMILFAGIFMITFTIKQIASFFITKARTEKMNDALKEFQKEHEWNEEK